MKKKEGLRIHGVFNLRHERNGEVIDEITIKNTVTDAGKAEVAGLINEQTSGGFKWIAIGDSGTAITSGNTALNAELTDPTGLDRAAATSSQVTTGVTDDTARLVHTFTNDSSNAIGIKEAGIFDTSTETSGNMFAAQTFGVKNLENSDTLKITYNVQVS